MINVDMIQVGSKEEVALLLALFGTHSQPVRKPVPTRTPEPGRPSKPSRG
jgi:hypothetical protein